MNQTNPPIPKARLIVEVIIQLAWTLERACRNNSPRYLNYDLYDVIVVIKKATQRLKVATL
jgi:hypothetical protein